MFSHKQYHVLEGSLSSTFVLLLIIFNNNKFSERLKCSVSVQFLKEKSVKNDRFGRCELFRFATLTIHEFSSRVLVSA